MRTGSTLSLALRRLRRRPIRSFLLLQGTVWGVAVALFPTAVIEGTRVTARLRAGELGADRIVAVADPTSAEPVRLMRDDVAFARERVEAQGHVVSSAAGVRVLAEVPPPAGEGAGRPRPTILLATPDAPRARGLELAAGRWLTRGDGPDRVVVEARVAKAYGTSLQPGSQIAVAGKLREIVGITKARTPSQRTTDDLGFDLAHPLYENVAKRFLLAMGIPHISGDEWKRTDACIYVPLGEDAAVEWIYVRVQPDVLSDAAKALRTGFVERGKAALTLYPIVLPVMLGSDVDRFDAVNFAMFLACLVMGAVVMANLGLLNALSRAREIAIRRVEGATRWDIAGHFLVEGFVLNLIGCALGCGLGMALAELRARLEPVAGFDWVFPTRQALIACGVALLIGVGSAVLPALRAARQDPVQGLADD